MGCNAVAGLLVGGFTEAKLWIILVRLNMEDYMLVGYSSTGSGDTHITDEGSEDPSCDDAYPRRHRGP